jgi:hypothetical protein
MMDSSLEFRILGSRRYKEGILTDMRDQRVVLLLLQELSGNWSDDSEAVLVLVVDGWTGPLFP